jgi:serine/threonine protein kinase
VFPYVRRRDGAWRLWLRHGCWSEDVWRVLRERVAAEEPSGHPRTVPIDFAQAGPVFLKIFYRQSPVASFKDFFRYSRAVRALRVTERLAASGFAVPIAMAAGEERHGGVLRRSFLVTLPVNGLALPVFLRDQLDKSGAVSLSLREKRRILAALAQELRKLHDLGFIHGDLVPGNIFVAAAGEQPVQFVFMDNDRTRRYPVWLARYLLARYLWRRNLVQLNRFPLAGISLQDRMRFFHAYVRRGKLLPQDAKLVRWLERKTRKRRAQCDAVDAGGSFRRLMRWNATSH